MTAPGDRDRPLRLSLCTSAAPDAHLLRAAIQARLDGRPFPAGAEAEVAEPVAAAVARRIDELREAKTC